jgi:uncharacterized protein YqgV (UPF0045/DUF77 family)
MSQVGTGNLSVAKEVAEVQRLLKDSGLKYTMHSAGTTVGKSASLTHDFYSSTSNLTEENRG